MVALKDLAEKMNQLSEEEKCHIKEEIKRLHQSKKYKKLIVESK